MVGKLPGIIRFIGVVLCGALVALCAPQDATWESTALAQDLGDYPIRAGRFYTQTGAGMGGFAVRDLAGVRFYSEYQRLGGPAVLGYPISRPFWAFGFLNQAFQRGLLQWRPATNEAVLANSMEILEPFNLQLFEIYSIPYPRQPARGTFAQELAERLTWLTNDQIREAFFSNPVTGEPWDADQAIGYYGLPQSLPQRHGPFIIQRFQRIPLQLWVEDIRDMPPPGTVVGVLSGELVKAFGLIPADALVPEPLLPPLEEVDPVMPPPAAPGPAPRPTQPAPVPFKGDEAESAASPTVSPTAGSYTVQPGDTLSGIAETVYGRAGEWPVIFEANQDQLASPSLVRPGMVLRIPG